MSTIQVYMVSIGVRVWSTLQYTLLEVVADVLKLQQNNFKSIYSDLGDYQGIKVQMISMK